MEMMNDKSQVKQVLLTERSQVMSATVSNLPEIIHRQESCITTYDLAGISIKNKTKKIHIANTLCSNSFSISSDISSDSRYAVFSEYSTIMIYSMETNKIIQKLHGHTKSVHSLKFSRCGNFIVSAGLDKTGFKWDVKSGKAVSQFKADDILLTIAISRCGNYVATGAYESGVLTIYTATTASVVKKHSFGRGCGINVVTFSSDGKYLFAGGATTCTLFEVGTWKIVDSRNNAVVYAAFSPDSRFLAYGNSNGKISVMCVNHGLNYCNDTTCQLIGIYDKNLIQSIAFAADGKKIISAHNDGGLRVWNIDDTCNNRLSLFKNLKGHYYSTPVYSVSASLNGKYILSVGRDGQTIIWNAQTLLSISAHGNELADISWSFDGNKLGLYTGINQMSHYDLDSGNISKERFWGDELLERKENNIYSTKGIIFNTNMSINDVSTYYPTDCNERIIFKYNDKSIKIYNTKTSVLIKSVSNINILKKYGTTLAAVEYDTIHLIDIVSGNMIARLVTFAAVSDVAFLSKKNILAYAVADKIFIHNISAAICTDISNGNYCYNKIDISPSGKYLVACTNDGIVHLFDVEQVLLLQEFNRKNIYKFNITDEYLSIEYSMYIEIFNIIDVNLSQFALILTNGNIVKVTGRHLVTSLKGVYSFWGLADGNKGQRLVDLYNLKEGFLWTTPPDEAAPNGWFWTNRPELLSLTRCNEDGSNPQPVPDYDPERLEYIKLYNDRRMVMNRLNNWKQYQTDVDIILGKIPLIPPPSVDPLLQIAMTA